MGAVIHVAVYSRETGLNLRHARGPFLEHQTDAFNSQARWLRVVKGQKHSDWLCCCCFLLFLILILTLNKHHYTQVLEGTLEDKNYEIGNKRWFVKF